MARLTMKALIDSAGIDARLIRSVVRQAGGWESFREMAPDVARHGAAGGFSGFIYYSETVPFAARNKAAILALCENMRVDIGEPDNVISFIAGFNGLQDLTAVQVAESLYNPKSENRTSVFNCLAWFALEETARAYCDISGED